MEVRKRLRLGDEHSSDSNPDCFEIRDEDQPIPATPLRKMHEDDVSGMETMFRRRKQLKITTTTLVSSSSNSRSKMLWTKNDELMILGSIVGYEKETKLSYRSDPDAFYGYVKDFIESNFSKKQLIDKIRNLNKRFLDNKASSNNGKGLSFTNPYDDDIFKMSMIIWDTNETESASNDNIYLANDVPCVDYGRVDEKMDQSKDVPCVDHGRADETMDQGKDVTYVEHERANELDQEKVVRSVEHEQVNDNINQAKDVPYVEHERANENLDQEKVVCSVEHEQVNDNINQANVDVPYVEHERSNENLDQEKPEQVNENINQAKDVPNVEHERVNENMDKENVDVSYAEHEPVSNVSMEENDGGDEDGLDEFFALQDALEATTLFQNVGKYQQKLLIQNLKNLGAQRRKDLTDEWKALLAEDMKLYAKKLTLSAKLTKAVGDSF